MIYFRLDLDAFARATQDLSMLEDGAYNRLLRYYYSKETPLPRDVNRVFEIARAITAEAQEAVRVVLDVHFKLQKDGYHNARADEEIAIVNIARNNGKGGGRPSKSNGGGQTSGELGEPSGQPGKETHDGTRNVTPEQTQTVTGNAESGSKPERGKTQTGTRRRTRKGTTEVTTEQTTAVTTSGTTELTGTGQPNKPTSTQDQNQGSDSLKRGATEDEPDRPPEGSAKPPESEAATNAAQLPKRPFPSSWAVTLSVQQRVLQLQPTWDSDHVERMAADFRRMAPSYGQAADWDDVFIETCEGMPAREQPEGAEAPEHPWWDYQDEVIARGAFEGVEVVPEQSFEDYKARVIAACGPGPWLDAQDEDMRDSIEQWRAIGVNPPQPAAATAIARR